MTQEALNIAGQCRATASSPLAKNILVDEGNGLLTELLLDAARIIEALAQPEQEPVATISVRWHEPVGKVAFVLEVDLPVGIHKVYTTPPQRTWVGLTDEEKQEWIDAMPYDPQPRHCMILVNIMEAKLKEKNT